LDSLFGVEVPQPERTKYFLYLMRAGVNDFALLTHERCYQKESYRRIMEMTTQNIELAQSVQVPHLTGLDLLMAYVVKALLSFVLYTVYHSYYKMSHLKPMEYHIASK